MSKKNPIGRMLALLVAALLLVSLAACGANSQKKDDMSGSDMKMEMTAEEAVAKFRELKAEETALLSENDALWEKVFLAMDKNNAMTMIEDGKNYGDYLLETIEAIKDQFAADELKLVQEAAEKIRELETELTMLEEKYPEAAQMAMDSDMDRVPDGTSMPADTGDMQKFPAFEGRDLDGNEVRSDELFSGNAVTVVNFWFTTCGPCVGELAELDVLNKELMEKGGALIGINAFTLDGGETEIADAKDVLMKKGATYQNVYFDSDSEAGNLVGMIYAYPTTYVVDRSGNIVGEPIVGAVTSKTQMEALRSLIDKTLAADMG
jgi:thiol-disulfide isomerase/thioredoxin